MKANLYGNEVLNGGSKPSSRSLLAGEQSDTLGLLRLNDRKHPRDGGFEPLYSLKNTWIEARSPTPHPGGDWPLAPGGGGLQIWTTAVAG